MADRIDIPMQAMQPSADCGSLYRAVGVAELGAQLATGDDSVLPTGQVGKSLIPIGNRGR